MSISFLSKLLSKRILNENDSSDQVYAWSVGSDIVVEMGHTSEGVYSQYSQRIDTTYTKVIPVDVKGSNTLLEIVEKTEQTLCGDEEVLSALHDHGVDVYKSGWLYRPAGINNDAGREE